jgi:adenylate cyclase
MDYAELRRHGPNKDDSGLTMENPKKSDTEAVIRWLAIEGPRQSDSAQLLHHYCLRLREAGVQVDRSTLGAPLLHPIAQSSRVFWDIENGPEQRWFTHTPDAQESMKASPIYPIYSRGEASSIRLDRPKERDDYPIGNDLWAEGYVQYEARPLQFSDGTYKALTLATRSPQGFNASNDSIIEATLPILALVFEGFVTRNTAITLMETYVGKRAGVRVLDGEIARGDGSHIDAVIWFSDLRGFTSLAQSRDEGETLDLLNDYFGRVTDAIEGHSGEVLKFIGDAMLAIFPHEGNVADAVARAESAALEVMNANDASTDYSFGIGLHYGSVFYGNIGGGNRLDFTVIGSAVNIASRIEGLCSELDRRFLASAAFVEKSSLEWESVGWRRLKGVSEPVEIFTPDLEDK